MKNIQTFCCNRCFGNRNISQYIQSHGQVGHCNYCNASGEFTVPLADVVSFIDQGLERKYTWALPGVLPLEAISAGGLREVLRTEEVFAELSPLEDSDLLAAVSELSRHKDELAYSQCFEEEEFGNQNYMLQWESFSEKIKYHKRFTAFMDSAPWVTRRRSYLWSELVNLLPSLIKSVTPETRICRARLSADGREYMPQDLGAPPISHTQNGRLNPVGVSFFYGCETAETCIAEVRPYLGAHVVIGEFKPAIELKIIDLCDTPVKKDMFDEDYDPQIDGCLKPFLYEFAYTISMPLDPSKKDLDYLPTQALCEFLKNALPSGEVHGIRYKSAMNEKGVCIVLFGGPEISEGPNRWIEYVGQKRYSVNSINYHACEYVKIDETLRDR